MPEFFYQVLLTTNAGVVYLVFLDFRFLYFFIGVIAFFLFVLLYNFSMLMLSLCCLSSA